MDRAFKNRLNKINKRVGVLSGLQRELNGLAGDMINKVKDPALREKLEGAVSEAKKGNKAPAEQLLKDLQANKK